QPPRDSALSLLITNPASAWGRAGLHAGDRLVTMNGTTLPSTADFRSFVNGLRIGDTVVVSVRRPTSAWRVSVVVAGYARPVVQLEEIPEATERQRPRQGVEAGLERARPLPSLHPPVPDLDLLFDGRHLGDLEDEAGGHHRLFEHPPRGGVELGRVAHQRELPLLIVAQRHEPRRLRPRKAAPHPHRALGAAANRPQPAVRASLEREGRGDGS